MTELTTFNELESLVQTARREDFGPASPRPFMVLELDNSSDELAEIIKDLPCPVIGVGNGELASVCDVVLENDNKLSIITKNIENAPMAAMVLVQHLRMSEGLSLQDTLTAESFAYSTVQKGPEFENWRSNIKPEPAKEDAAPPPLSVTTNDNRLELILNDPDNFNTIGIPMRDALCEALDLALLNPDISRIYLTGAGRAFSTGGDIAEFGDVTDPARAHWVRSLRLPAWRLARLTDRLHVHVNGAAIGAGAEIAVFGSHVTASKKAWFQLPELKYGLIPGAGGTASLPKRIGRQRTAYMALSMEKIYAQTALDWGLINEIVN